MERIDIAQSNQYPYINKIPLHGHRLLDEVSDRHNEQRHRYHNHFHQRPLIHRHPPFFIVFISILQVLSFIYYAWRYEIPITWFPESLVRSALIYNPSRRYELWRFITYMFVHNGLWHITFNILLQLAFGIPLEMDHKFDSVLIIYLGGVLSGALANSILKPSSNLAGASGGCYAIIVAHVSNVIINWKELQKPYFRLIAPILLSICDVSAAIYRKDKTPSDANLCGDESLEAHLGGAIAGLLLGFIFLKNYRVHKWEQVTAHYSAATYILLTLSVIAFHVFNKDRFPIPDNKPLEWTSI